MPPSELPCISVRQPWADLIVDGVKDIENRTWPTDFRGAILVHAPRKVDWPAADRFRDSLPIGPMGEYEPVIGAIVGVAELVGCVSGHPSRFFQGPYGFVLERPARLPEPVPAPGRLGIFNVPARLLSGHEELLARF